MLPVWASNGELFYLSGSAMNAVSVTRRDGSLVVSKPLVLFQTGGDGKLAPVFDVTPDGKTFDMLRARGREHLSMIFNWPRALAELEASGPSALR